MSRNKSVFYVGDTVKIVTPDIVYKVGYDYDFSSAREEIVSKHSEDVHKLIANITGHRLYRNDKAFIRIINALAYRKLSGRKYTRKDRRIYTTHKPELAGCEFEIAAKSVVYTGTYVPGHSGGYPDYDAEPPTLMNSKAHILLHLHEYGTLVSEDTTIKIDSLNVVLLQHPKKS